MRNSNFVLLMYLTNIKYKIYRVSIVSGHLRISPLILTFYKNFAKFYKLQYIEKFEIHGLLKYKKKTHNWSKLVNSISSLFEKIRRRFYDKNCLQNIAHNDKVISDFSNKFGILIFTLRVEKKK